MVYIIHGEDSFRSRIKRTKFKETASTQGVRVTLFDFSDTQLFPDTLILLKTTLSLHSLFTQKELIVFSSILDLSLEHTNSLKKIILTSSSSTKTLLFYEYKKIPKTNSFYKELMKVSHPKVEEYKKMSSEQLVAYLQDRLRENKMEIQNKDAVTLINHVQEDLYALDLLIQKICISFPNEPIFQSHYFDTLHIYPISRVFALTQYLFMRQPQNYIELLSTLQRQGEDPFLIFGFIRSQVRKALMLRSIQESKNIPFQKLGMAPYALKSLQNQIKKISTPTLEDFLQKIVNTDISIKSSGKNPWEALEDLVLP